MNGIDELRKLVSVANWTHESAFAGLDIYQTINLLRACRALDLETLPDMLTEYERKFAATQGWVSDACLRRLYRHEGLPETGPNWEGRHPEQKGADDARE